MRGLQIRTFIQLFLVFGSRGDNYGDLEYFKEDLGQYLQQSENMIGEPSRSLYGSYPQTSGFGGNC